MVHDEFQNVSIGWLLRTAFDQYHEQVLAQVHQAGFTDVTPAQAHVMAYIDDTPVKAVVLAARVGVSKQAASVMAAELVHKNYLMYQPDPKDGRAKLLALSDQGRRLKQAGQTARQAAERQFLSKLNDQQRYDLKNSLQSLIRV